MRNSLTHKDVLACPKLWRDIEAIKKRNPKICTPREDCPNGASDKTKLIAIPLTEAILNVITDPENGSHGTLHGNQPFLAQKMKIYKLRYAVDKQGASKGIRVIYASDGETLIFVYIYSKRPTPDGRKIEAELQARLKEFLGIKL